MMNVQVRKKNGSLESYSTGKIAASVEKAGGASELAQELVDKINYYVSNAAKKGVVRSKQIRSKLVDLLDEKDAGIANTFKNFKKK